MLLQRDINQSAIFLLTIQALRDDSSGAVEVSTLKMKWAYLRKIDNINSRSSSYELKFCRFVKSSQINILCT